MNAPANRGKYAEGEIKKYLKLLNDSHMNFTYNRNPDAHAAGGRFVPVAGDFQAFHQVGTAWVRDVDHEDQSYTDRPVPLARNFIIEVKEVAHDFRLPHANYSADKVARVEKRCKAGTEAIVMIYHTKLKTWRAVPQAVFNDRSTGGSWDLRAHEPVDFKRALSEFLGVLP